MAARLTLPTLVFYLLLIFARGIDAQSPGQTADGQESYLTKAAQAVVRVEACTGATCRAGSGAIIDPSGIILTAWHVTAISTQTLDSPLFANFNIQMIDDVALPPETRYQAQVIASKPDQDLALLRITYDVNEGRTVTPGTDLGLPWLPLSTQTPQEGQLRIMGKARLAMPGWN
jgi:S1-C subfamily serine protease